ncbi:MAG TPA: HDOD domain-containing protein, partial [Methyloradius sp.]
ELKDRGFRLAIDDFVYRSEYDPILPLIDYLKVDLEITSMESLPKVIAEIRKHSNAILLAEKVEQESQYLACKDLGFTLFQGYFFAHPVVITGKKPQPNQINLMRIMGMLIGDANVSELEVPFKESPTLTISLLRLVNSVAVSGGRRQEISTLRQAIVILGQKQLLRWVQLLLYVSPEGDIANSLMQQVSNRARLMELIANRLDNYKATGDQAFMVGMLSLIHAVLKTPQEEVLAQIAIPETLKLAITKREGLLGQLLNLTEMIEKYEFEAASAAIHELGMSVSDFTSIQLQAMQWANELNKQAQD